jgi:phospholipase/carboxylesterase
MTAQDQALDDLTVLLPPLLQSLETLGFIARHLDPPRFMELMEAIGTPDADLRTARPRLDAWPDEMAGLRGILGGAIDATLTAYDELRVAPEQSDGLGAVFKALRHLQRAQETLYPLARDLPPLNRFFLDPDARGDEDLLKRITAAEPRDDTGVLHVENEPGARGGFSLYVPEYYDPARAWPVVFALHGGSGNGRGFLWSWLRDARSYGAIVVSPTSVGRTWAIQGPDPDTPNLARMLDMVRRQWHVDDRRLLLSGMSDGGTFSYVSGLEPTSPFTHLAPAAAAFHPMMAQFADRERMTGLPIHITHGVLDWMFPVGMAREAQAALAAAGANVTYREIDDLPHSYPRVINRELLAWLA